MSLINDALKRAKKRTTVRPPQSSFSHDSMQPVGERTQRMALETQALRSQPHTPWPWIVAALLALGLCLAIAGWFFGNAVALMRSAKASSSPQALSSIEPRQSPNAAESSLLSTASISEKESEIFNQPPSFALKKLSDADADANASQVLQVQETSPKPQAAEDHSNTSVENLANAHQTQSAVERIEEHSTPEPTAKAQESKQEVPVYLSSIPAEGDWPDLKLQGIFYHEDDPVALINNRDLLAGESIGKVEIVSIESKKVTLRLGNELKILQFRR